MRKKPFLLLEILIAFSVLTICAIPLVKQPLKLYKEELEQLEEMEYERLADWAFTEVKELLLKNEIPWKELPEKGIHTKPFSLPSATLQIPGCKVKTVERQFILSGRGQKTGLHQETYRQLGVYIFLNKKKYTYRLPVQKRALDPIPTQQTAEKSVEAGPA